MRRTILKTGTYAAMHFSVAIGVAYALTRDWHVALAVGIVEPAVQTVAFAIHERLWSLHSDRLAHAAGVQRMLHSEDDPDDVAPDPTDGPPAGPDA